MTISNLVPEQCLCIMEKMHAKKFLGRKIFVTSVVENSPVKPQPEPQLKPQPEPQPSVDDIDSTSPAAEQASIAVVSHIPINKSSKIAPLITSPILDPKAASSLATSKTIECQSTSLAEFDFADMYELPSKRKASLSPETKELTRKDKKAAKRELKAKNKSYQNVKMQLSPTNN